MLADPVDRSQVPPRPAPPHPPRAPLPTAPPLSTPFELTPYPTHTPAPAAPQAPLRVRPAAQPAAGISHGPPRTPRTGQPPARRGRAAGGGGARHRRPRVPVAAAGAAGGRGRGADPAGGAAGGGGLAKQLAFLETNPQRRWLYKCRACCCCFACRIVSARATLFGAAGVAPDARVCSRPRRPAQRFSAGRATYTAAPGEAWQRDVRRAAPRGREPAGTGAAAAAARRKLAAVARRALPRGGDGGGGCEELQVLLRLQISRPRLHNVLTTFKVSLAGRCTGFRVLRDPIITSHVCGY
jgi:hypothetical protein